ncbi:MAG: deoxyribodipyrimidine photo-lyase [Chloroflexota bacterium]
MTSATTGSGDPAPIVVWFRRDLRLDDHPALAAAVATGRPIVPLVVLDPGLLSSSTLGARRRSRHAAAVVALDRDLRAIGGRLIVQRGTPRTVLPRIVSEVGATEILATRDFTPYAVARDQGLMRDLPLQLLPGCLIVEPEATGQVRVFAAFHRRWAALPRPSLIAAPSRVRVLAGVESETLPDAVPRGGPEARFRLEAFARDRAADYADARNRLDMDGTSGLSADLHFGTLSVRRAMATVSNEAFRRQLAWRDWSHHLLWFASDGAVPSQGGEVTWRDDPKGIDAWIAGETGIPTVDAAMRELATTGTMHNRARMIVASFLTKDLLVDWRVGEAHFLRTLEDADIANNRLGWRWSAGVGADAAPFFRVMNPSLQGERFDPHGTWVRRWIPELAEVPDRFVHRPWDAPYGPPRTYPQPIVDHVAARSRALEAFRDRSRQS